MSYLVVIELEDFEEIHSCVNTITGEIIEFEQEFVNKTKSTLPVKYLSNNTLPVVAYEDLQALFSKGFPNYKNHLKQKK